MNKERILEFISRPAFISFVIWVLIAAFIPPLFSKFTVRHVKDEDTDKDKYYFYDIDNDGLSEKVRLILNDPDQTILIFYSGDKTIEQYNLKYQVTGGDYIFTGDYNHDGYKECYVFTQSRDSIFLNVIDPLKSQTTLISHRFVDFRRKAEHSVDGPGIMPVGMFRGKDRSYKDFVFCINTGFSKQPRNVYRYSVKSDSLVKSPASSAGILGCIASDITGDGLPEFILEAFAPGNFDEDAPFSDQYAWLMVLNNDLDFLFPPVQFKAYPSRLTALPFRLKNKFSLVLFHDYYGTANLKSAFYLYDTKGDKLYEKPVEGYDLSNARIFNNPDSSKGTFYFLKKRDGEIEEIDTGFKVVKKLLIPDVHECRPVKTVDANYDGKIEYIFQGRDKKSLVISQNDFRHSAIFRYDRMSEEYPVITQVFSPGDKPCLYIQFDNYGSYIRFYKNPLYFLKYPFYAVLFPVVLLFVVLISRLLEYRINMIQQTERKIAALQMKAIKNQVDPHFTLNMLNAIGSLYATEENRERADYIFAKYARLIRQTVISSDQVIIALEDELDFVRNYIDLERFRCGNSFDYTIDIGQEVDLKLKIPRMLIYTFVENAIKYGITGKAEGASLKIVIKAEDKTCIVVVEDNGEGLAPGRSPEKGTGKGLLILNQMIDLYYKLEKSRITWTLQNIYDSDNTIAGTRAEVRIQLI